MTRRLLLLNGLAVIGAVINHASGWAYTSLFFWTDRYAAVAVPDFSRLGTPTYYGVRALEQLIIPSLPAFLFVSGYFVAFAAGRGAPRLGWDKVGARIQMLLIPYLLWSLAIVVGRSLEGNPPSSGGVVEQLLFGRAAEPYYYIPLLTQLYLLSPVLVPWIRTHWKPVLAAAALLQLIVQLARYPILLGWEVAPATWIYRHAPGWFFPHMVFWFVLGVFAGFHLSLLKRWLAGRERALAWVAGGLAVLALVEWELLQNLSGRDWLNPTPTLLDSFYSLAVILAFVALAERRLPASPGLDALGERSFGVYLVHAPVLELMSRAAYHLTPLLLAYQLVFLPLLIVAGVAVPLALMAVVRRSPARPYYNYLFG